MPTLPNVNVNSNPPTPTVVWRGASGRTYTTYLHPIGTSYYAIPGVYIACAYVGNGQFRPAYVGETESFRQRLTDGWWLHHQRERIVACGATHFCTMHVPGDRAYRLAVEADLRHGLNPSCNDQ